MFYIIKDWKLDATVQEEIEVEWARCISKNFTDRELKLLEHWVSIDENNELIITPEIEMKIELADIEKRLKESKDRYTELKEMWEMRSNAEEIEFQALETWKNTLLARRKQILDSL